MKKSLILLVILLFIISGCANKEPKLENSDTNVNKSVLKYEIGSNNWESITKLGATEKVIEAYDFAVSNPEVLSYIPCYCGCYEEEGHTSNRDCFVDSVDKNVAILDNMGLG